MVFVKIINPRFAEGWKAGDFVGMDNESAKVPLANGDVEERMKHLEITTMLPCVNNCSYCPQALLKSKYRGERMMTLGVFKKILKNVPVEVDIHFSGFSESFGNREAVDMMRHASEKGHNVIVYTTTVGMTDEDIEKMKDIKFAHFVVHKRGIPTKEIPFKHHTIEVDNVVSRAGNLFEVTGNGRYCERTESFEQNVVLPNGDVVLCCMDYGLNHKIGNLISMKWEELGRDIKNGYDLCLKCEASKCQ